MTDTLVVEGVPVSDPAPEPETQPIEPPVDPPQAPPEPPPGDPGPGGDPQQPQPILETAFVVYLNPQGHWMVAADLHSAAEMQIARPPNVDDFFYGCSMVVKDIHVQETAATAVAMQQQALQNMAEQARQAAMNQQIAQALGPKGPAGGIDLSQLGRNH